MALVLFGAVRTTTLVAIIESGEEMPPSMRASEAGRPEQTARPELKSVMEERGFEASDVHDDGVREPGLGRQRCRPAETEPLFELGVGGDEDAFDRGEGSFEHMERGQLGRIDELEGRGQL